MGSIAALRDLSQRIDEQRIDPDLSRRWLTPPAGLDKQWHGRLSRFRSEVIPWLNASRPLAGRRILEVGVGTGASTFALAEQGVDVVGIDVDEGVLRVAEETLLAAGLQANLRQMNAEDLRFAADGADQVIFWAVLEHMTTAERVRAIESAWSALPMGGLLTVVETPNRLWPMDMHTSKLPYFSWLPSDLAYQYSRHSSRPTFGDRYLEATPDDLEMLHFQRRGHGVSYHEFCVALQRRVTEITVDSCMQLERRNRARYRKAGWFLSSAGRTERTVRAFDPQTDRAWFQPMLYLSLLKS